MNVTFDQETYKELIYEANQPEDLNGNRRHIK